MYLKISSKVYFPSYKRFKFAIDQMRYKHER